MSLNERLVAEIKATLPDSIGMGVVYAVAGLAIASTLLRADVREALFDTASDVIASDGEISDMDSEVPFATEIGPNTYVTR